MEPQDENSTDSSKMGIEDLRKLFVQSDANKALDTFLAQEDLNQFARYLAVDCLEQNDEDISVFAGLMRRISEAVGEREIERGQITDAISYLVSRLYIWSYTGEQAAYNFGKTAKQKG